MGAARNATPSGTGPPPCSQRRACALRVASSAAVAATRTSRAGPSMAVRPASSASSTCAWSAPENTCNRAGASASQGALCALSAPYRRTVAGAACSTDTATSAIRGPNQGVAAALGLGRAPWCMASTAAATCSKPCVAWDLPTRGVKSSAVAMPKASPNCSVDTADEAGLCASGNASVAYTVSPSRRASARRLSASTTAASPGVVPRPKSASAAR